jgi:hypothetical protein
MLRQSVEQVFRLALFDSSAFAAGQGQLVRRQLKASGKQLV